MEGWGWGDDPPLHCDMETVPGAKIIHLKRVWERASRDNPLPLDTVLVGLYAHSYCIKPEREN
jgi:hypothetical protein